MKYIDADKLKAELNRRIELYGNPLGVADVRLQDERKGMLKALSDMLTFIDFLQQEQPEVDLEEEEIEKWWQNWASPPRNEYAVFNKGEFINLARHFYELGLNARKERESN